jgi:hypothetical protein
MRTFVPVKQHLYFCPSKVPPAEAMVSLFSSCDDAQLTSAPATRITTEGRLENACYAVNLLALLVQKKRKNTDAKGAASYPPPHLA